MITRLRLINYRSHADSEIRLSPITLLVGPVASGKSNLFKGLWLLQNSIHRSLVELFPPGLGEFHWVRSRWAGETDPIGFEVEVDNIEGYPDTRAKYILKIGIAPEGLFILEESLSKQLQDEPWQWVFQRHSLRPRIMGEYGEYTPSEPSVLNHIWHRDARIDFNARGPQFAKQFAKCVSSFGYYHLEASNLRSLGSGMPCDHLDYNGANLPDFIAWLKFSEERTTIYETILEQMREILPDLDEIIVTQVESGKQGLAMSFKKHRGYIAAPDLSDGTLFTLGILSILHSPKQPSSLCFEEPETGLHPGRLRWLFDKMLSKAYSPDNSSTQILISTHSPCFMDYFGSMPESVQNFSSIEGRSQVRSLEQLYNLLHLEKKPDEPIGQLLATGLYDNL